MRIVDLSKLNCAQLEEELQTAQDQMNSWACKRITELIKEKGKTMADKLTEIYNAWINTKKEVPTEFECFQAGFTAAAVSMRTRAMAVVDKNKDVNKIKNGIGSLSDIPE